MKDKDKTKEQLIKELEELRQRISGLRKLETKFKQTQKEVKESQERFRAVFSVSDEIIFIKNLEGHYTQANAAFSRIFKRPLEEIIGRTDEEIFPREEAKVLREIDLEVLKRGETDTREDVLTVKGDVHIFRTTKVPLRNEAGKIIGLCGFAEDITDSKRMGEELEERRMYLENIMKYLPDAVITQDAEGKVLEWNPEAERLFGYTSKEAIGKKLDDLIASPDPDKFREATGITQQILGGKPISPVEAVRYRKDGTSVDVLLSASPIFAEDKPIGIIAAYRDITESKRLEREVKERRLYLESVMDSTPDAIVTTDNKHRVKEWNPGAERLFGYSRDEVIGKNLDNLIRGSNPDALKEATSLTKQVLTEKKSVPPTEAIRYRKDGTPVDVILSGS
ncbi:MAG: PAS domain S-box protein, partial [bacterium]|nr:PAS domain S-box protein [bacterium]